MDIDCQLLIDRIWPYIPCKTTIYGDKTWPEKKLRICLDGCLSRLRGRTIYPPLHSSMWKTHIEIDHFPRQTTVDGRNIQTPSIRYNPLAPKVQCYCNLKCVSPNGRKKIKPLTSLLLTRALKHWDLGVRGFNKVRAAGFEYFVHLL